MEYSTNNDDISTDGISTNPVLISKMDSVQTDTTQTLFGNTILSLEDYYDTKEAIDKNKEKIVNKSLINPPKRTTLAISILDVEAANIILKIEKELSKSINLTLNSYIASAALREEIIYSFMVGGNLKLSNKTRWSTLCIFIE
ncbi:6845_t:CDS:2 [Dentiscutata erythropus]|uniref:6845_t:CDS:1 n=1 Tax=Dentiscutata erythropus TaxID=1348616 RepID=A0A9N9HRZ6_9GLOM|nr:6845_t:CDS:2 [Dentiscutata erythropus]